MMVQKKKAASAARKRTKAVDSGTPASIITSLNVSILMFSALGAFQLINQTFDLKQMIVFASIILQGLAMCFFWRRIDSHLKVISGFTYISTTWLFLIGTAAKDLLPIASMVPSLGLIGITITSLILLTVWMLDNRSAPTIIGGIFGAVLIASTFLQQGLDLSIDSSSMINLSAKSPDDETIMASDMDAYSYEPIAKSKKPEEDKHSSYLTKIKSQIREIGSKVPEIISKSKAKDTKLTSQPATKQARWAYTGKNGPRYWAQLNPEFRLCSSGREQSPISIPNNWDLMKELRTFYKPTPYKISYSKNGVRVTLPQGPQSYMNKELFQAKKLSFHTPSEHLYQGHSFPAEIQIHHRNKQGKLSIISILAMQGKHNKELDKVINYLPTSMSKPVEPQMMLSLNQFVPQDLSAFHYLGSMTTPPCREGVMWYILNNPIELSKKQIAKLRSKNKNNARPVQALYHRR